jgi:hypothetical protein
MWIKTFNKSRTPPATAETIVTDSSSKNVGNSRIDSIRRDTKNITNRGMQAKVGKFTTQGPPATEMPTAAMTPKKSGTSEQTKEQKRNISNSLNARNNKNGSTGLPQATAETPAVNIRYVRSESISTRNNELSLKFTKKSKKSLGRHTSMSVFELTTRWRLILP